jgi:hypothetical protein
MNSIPPSTVAIIGSFRKHYDRVLAAIDAFVSAGLTVSSPTRSYTLDAKAEFVRFATDPPGCADVEIQLRALQRILSSDVVFVVAPDGYVGRTTCYEIGRVHERKIPIFYSSMPLDLPIPVSANAVADAAAVAKAIQSGRRPVIDQSDVPTAVRTLWEVIQSAREGRDSTPTEWNALLSSSDQGSLADHHPAGLQHQDIPPAPYGRSCFLGHL